MRQELETAGVNYQDREVVVNGNLISSRQPADIPAFMQAIFQVIGLV
jgi:protease I